MRVRKMLFFLFIISLFFFPVELFSQPGRELTTTSNRAKRAFEDAVQKYSFGEFEAAAESFRDALRHDPQFIEVYIVMGEMFTDTKDYDEAIEAFENAIRIDPDFFPNAFYSLAGALMATGQYDRAYRAVDRYLQFQDIHDSMRQNGKAMLARAEFGREAVKNPVPFEPKNLGSNINTEYDEYAPTLTADEQTLIITRKKPHKTPDGYFSGFEYEDFYVSFREDGEWTEAVNLGPPINTDNNEGAQSISADGMHLYFTGCNRPGGMGSCDIYYSRRIGNRWSEPENLGFPVNTAAWESQPSISPDGKTLYFTSGREGNYGRMDLWVTTQISPGVWSEPENLGPDINTRGREMSPFIHPDNRTLYFASDGHLGMGGLDLFYTVRNSDGQWQEPVNLGYPINTHADEMSLVVGASGKEAYFASEQPGGEGGSDIYFFELYEEARPTPVTYMKGFVFDAETRIRLEARFQLIDVATDEIIAQSVSNARTGEFMIPIPVGANLALNAWRDGYLFFSENFAFQDIRTGIDPHLYDVPLQPIKEGETVVLRNIFFKTDSHELLAESMPELRKLLELMQENPRLEIEISGHTDSTGSYEYNKTLSTERALSVVEYLTDNGVEKQRLTYKGYADDKPIATNETEEGRAQNRRTEFKVIGGMQ